MDLLAHVASVERRQIPLVPLAASHMSRCTAAGVARADFPNFGRRNRHFFLESVRSIASAALKGVDCDSDPSENSSLRIFQACEGAQIPRKMRCRTPKKWHFASEVGSEGRNLPRGGGFCSPHVPSRSQRHKLREYGTKEARKRLFSNLYLNTFPASTANPLGAARPTHFFWRALRSSTRRGDLQR